MSAERPGPIVEVEWSDSTGRDGWHSPEEAVENLDKMQCLAAGYLVADDERGIVLALGHGALDQHLSSMAIPRHAIVSVRHLEGES